MLISQEIWNVSTGIDIVRNGMMSRSIFLVARRAMIIPILATGNGMVSWS